MQSASTNYLSAVVATVIGLEDRHSRCRYWPSNNVILVPDISCNLHGSGCSVLNMEVLVPQMSELVPF